MPPDSSRLSALSALCGHVTHLPRGLSMSASGTQPLSGLTILLVEDSRFSADALRLLCQRSGARMRRAETLEQAAAHLRTYRPDVVIVDLGLPDGRGEDLIRALSGMAEAAPLVLASSGDPAARAGALAAGAVDFLEKPLPGLAAFQAVLIRHLPGRVVATDVDATASADPLALRDDLRLAADLLEEADDPVRRRYLAGFLTGLARSTGDVPLGRAAAGVASGDLALAEVRAVLRDRLNRSGVI